MSGSTPLARRVTHPAPHVVRLAAFIGLFAPILTSPAPALADTTGRTPGTRVAATGPAVSLPPVDGAFRLGTAAAPFGWSTAIADFDADGRPDFAIADHLGHGTQRYTYSLQITVSSVSSQTATFESLHDALSLTIGDIDHDNDFDLIITPVFTREVVAIWLNDGRGRFHRADLHEFPSALPPLSRLTSEEGTAVWEAELTPAPVDALRLVVCRFLSVPDIRPYVALSPIRKAGSILPSSLALRGPPVSLS